MREMVKPPPDSDQFVLKLHEHRLELGGNTELAAYLNTQNPLHCVRPGYISAAVCGTTTKNGSPICPPWFVFWYCKKYDLPLPVDHQNRQTQGPLARRMLSRVKQSGTDSPVTHFQQHPNKHAEDTHESRRITELERRIEMLTAQQRAVSVNGSASLPQAAKIFVDSLMTACNASTTALRQRIGNSEAESLERACQSTVDVIERVLFRLGHDVTAKR